MMAWIKREWGNRIIFEDPITCEVWVPAIPGAVPPGWVDPRFFYAPNDATAQALGIPTYDQAHPKPEPKPAPKTRSDEDMMRLITKLSLVWEQNKHLTLAALWLQMWHRCKTDPVSHPNGDAMIEEIIDRELAKPSKQG